MAGFDFEFDVATETEEVAGVVLRASQRRAQEVGVTLRYRRTSPTRYLVEVNGSLLFIEPLAERLLRDLPAVVEGCHNAGLSPRGRRRMVERYTRALLESLDDFLVSHVHVADQLRGLPVSITVNVGSHTHLVGRMRIFRMSLAMFLNGDLDAATMLEEAHTALEALLRAVAGRGSGDLSFGELVRAARELRILNEFLARELLGLKDLRRGAKHHGRGVGQAAVDDLVQPMVAAAQRLAAYLRHGSSTGGGPVG